MKDTCEHCAHQKLAVRNLESRFEELWKATVESERDINTLRYEVRRLKIYYGVMFIVLFVLIINHVLYHISLIC